MIKNILIPIDFTIESLNTLKLALEEHRHKNLNVVLMHSERLSSSITELLFYNPIKIIKSLISVEFSDAINILKNTFESSLQSVRIEIFHGINKAAFENFCEANQIDLIYIPKNYRLAPTKDGFDPIHLIKKSNIPFKEVHWNTDNQNSNEDQLNQLFK